jgi:meso-butanediol dehydrogenase / (S,S)-butanediol dehydrogenase / diacetyl reductase
MGTRMAGKVALVTGSTRGIGRSMAELFAGEGAKVAVTGRTVEKGEKVVSRIKEAGGEAEFFRLDITDENSIKEVVDGVVDRFGSLTTLVNNAAPTDVVASTVKPLHEYTNDEWDRILLGVLKANVFWATKYAWPHLAAAEGASILNVSSSQSLLGITGFGAYAAAKGGMNSVTLVLAVEGAAQGIRCNGVVVGRVVSGSGDSGVGMGASTGGRLTRIGNPMDIAHIALLLSSDEGGFMTGELLVADGGVTINGDALMSA